MSPVDFKKWQCPLSLFINFPVDFKVVQCRLSNLRKHPVALSNLMVKGSGVQRSKRGMGGIWANFIEFL